MSRAPRAVLLTGNVLCNNPRVIKEADTLADAGWDVEVLGAWLTPQYVERDQALMAGRQWRYTPVIRPGSATWPRVRTRLGREIGARLGWQNRWQVGYAGSELLRAALDRDADIYVAHSEPALWAAQQLARRGRRIGVDFEDWFSRDTAVDTRLGRATSLLAQLECEVARAAATATCTSHAMSAAIAAACQCAPPAVVYNAFPWSDRSSLDGQRRDRTTLDRPSILWYSQTLGPGRGLELLCAALADMPYDAEVHLRGVGSDEYEASLVQCTPESWRARLFFHDPVTNDELPSRIAEHDIAFSCEDASSPSRDLTITNKVLHGMLAGLAVVASDTAGTREVAALAPGGVRVFEPSRPATLVACLGALLGSRVTLDEARRAALDAARTTLSWEHQQSALLEAFSRALSAPEPS